MDEPSQPESNRQEPDRVASNEPQPVGVAVVVHRSSDVDALSLDNVEGIEIRRSTFDINADVLSDRAVDVLLVDLTFPGERAIEFIRQSVDEHPQVGILALAPEPVPYELVVLAVEAGALGFVTAPESPDSLSRAFRRVAAGDPWLPPDSTLVVLQDVSAELESTSAERTSQLWAITLAVVPILGGMAAFLSFVWRKYWGQIGVRPVDLAIEPGTRVADVLISLSLIVGVFGPLAFISGWLDTIGEWIDASPRWATRLARGRQVRFFGIPFGRLLLNRNVAWLLIGAAVLSITLLIATYASLLSVLVIGPVVGISLLARALNLDHELPPILRSERVSRSGLIAGTATVALIFMLVVGGEAFLRGPDLRQDGVHGILAKQVLGFSAQPVVASNVDGAREPVELLYLGGNADLYVLYNPCNEVVEYVSVGSTHIEVIDEVSCP